MLAWGIVCPTRTLKFSTSSQHTLLCSRAYLYPLKGGYASETGGSPLDSGELKSFRILESKYEMPRARSFAKPFYGWDLILLAS